jgi:hypothetical protein
MGEIEHHRHEISQLIWIRYVDDIFCVMKKNTIDTLLVIMNLRHSTIKFTHEIENNGTLFLNTQIKCLDKKLSFNVYRCAR